jgi:acylphosphatase
MVQAHILYSGMVQGVGFRYTAHRIARSLDVHGWVRNLGNGQVEILAEGSKETIEKLTKELGDHFGSYIKDKHVTFENSPDQFKDFQIIS